MAKVTIDLYVSKEFQEDIPQWDVWIGQLDVGDSQDMPLNMTFQCSDAIDPTVKKGNHSQTFQVPASNHNINVLKNLNNVLSGTINDQQVLYAWSVILEMTRKHKFDAIISVDSNNVLWGTLQIKSVTNLKGNPTQFECLFLSGNSDWSTLLTKKTLNELYPDTQVNYFSGQRLAEHFIGTTFDFDTEQHNFGDGGYWVDYINYVGDAAICYPTMSYGQPQFQNFLTVEDHKPCLFIYDMVKRMFDSIGYEIQSEFIEKDFFRRLIYPLHDTRYGTAQLELNRIDVVQTSYSGLVLPYASSYAALYTNNSLTSTPNSENAGGRPLKCNQETLDPASAYDPSTGHFVVPSTGYYNINANVQALLTNQNAHYKGELVVQINLIPTGIYAGTPQANDIGPMQHNNVAYVYDPNDNNTQEDREITCQVCIDACYLLAGDTVVVKAGLLNPGGSYPNIGQSGNIFSDGDEISITNATSITYGVGSTFTCELLPILAAHSYYKLNDFIPAKNCMEFFKGLTHLFNLQVHTDSQKKLVYIEPFDTFYGYDTKLNAANVPYLEEIEPYIWSEKLDRSTPIKDKFLETLTETFVIDYAEDKSDFNLTAYREGNVMGVGDGQVNVGLGGYAESLGHGFPSGVTNYTNPHFAATFEHKETAYSGMISAAPNAGAVVGAGNLQQAPRIPCMFAGQGDLTNTFEPERPMKSNKFEPRILYFQGYRKFKSPITVASASGAGSPYEAVMCFDYDSSGYQINLAQEQLSRACFSNVNVPFQADFQAEMTITSTTGQTINGLQFEGGILVGYTNYNGQQTALVMANNNLTQNSGNEMFTWLDCAMAAPYFDGTEISGVTNIFQLAGTPPDYGWVMPTEYDANVIAAFFYSEAHQNLEPSQQLTSPSGYWFAANPQGGSQLDAGGAWYSVGNIDFSTEEAIVDYLQGTEFGVYGYLNRCRYVKHIALSSSEWTSFSATYNITGGELVPYTALYGNTWVLNDLVNLNFNDVEAYNPFSTVQGSGTTAGTQTFSNKGLYNMFWRNMIDALKTRPRMRKCKIMLNQRDITTINLRRLVYLDGEYWRISKISNYKPAKDEPTEVVLIQHMQGNSLFKGNS